MKKLPKISRSVALVAVAGLLLCAPLFAETSAEVKDKRESILSKSGLDIGGIVQADYTRSSLTGTDMNPAGYDLEKVQMTLLDLELGLRPADFVGGKLILRFYQDWQTFFAYRSKPVSVRWMSMDGKLAKHLSYSVGDFRQKYSPLTLFTPEPEFVYEPEIFARERELLMREEFLGDNQRVLQGANLNLVHEFMPGTEVRLDGLAGRLQRPERLDANLRGEKIGAQNDGFELSDMDRFFWGTNFEVLALDGIFLAGSYLGIDDDKSSFETRELEMIDSGVVDQTDLSLNWRENVMAYSTRIYSGRGGLDIAALAGLSGLKIEALGELALSEESNTVVQKDSVDNFVLAADGSDSLSGQVWPSNPKSFKGYASRVELTLGWTAPDTALSFKLRATYLQNDKEFRNPLAQSPAFLKSRIMNWENDNATGALYSTFDALYNGVYKFTPQGIPENNHFAPFTKSAWHNGIQSPGNLDGRRIDPVVQLWLPYGDATPDIKGVSTKFDFAMEMGIEIQGLFGQLEQSEPLAGVSAVKTLRYGGGTKLHFDKMLSLEKTLELSVSYIHTEAARDALVGEAEAPTALAPILIPSVAVDLISGGFYWRFARRWAFLSGLQRSTLLAKNGNIDSELVQRVVKAGVEYGMNRWASLALSAGQIQSNGTSTIYMTLPDATFGTVKSETDFAQLLTSVTVRVDF